MNFHIFYFFYDAVEAKGELEKYHLEAGRAYRYLRLPETPQETKLPYHRDNPEANVARFNEFENGLKLLEFTEENIEDISSILSAILCLGNVCFSDIDKFAEIENVSEAHKVAKLLKLDEKKFEWALVNYCVVQGGKAERRRHTSDEARDARDALSATIYCRLVDWIANIINQKLAFNRAVL